MTSKTRTPWSGRKALFVILCDWGIAAAAGGIVILMHHYSGWSMIPALISVAAVVVAVVAFVGAPIVVLKRTGQWRWLLGIPAVAVIAGAIFLGRAEYHHVQTAHALAAGRKVITAAKHVVAIVPTPRLASQPSDPAARVAWFHSTGIAYQRSIERASSALSRFNVKVLRVLPATRFLPRLDLSVGELAFCYVPDPIFASGFDVILGTCESPDWETMAHIPLN